MHPNPYDPWKRTDLTTREKVVLRFSNEIIHGDNLALIDDLVSEHYVQHTHGIAQGRPGLRRFLETIAWKRPGRRTWRPIQIFSAGDFVILHKLLPAVVIADIFRFDSDDKLVEHWDVVQTLPEPDYDPMKPSAGEDFTRFYALFNMQAPTSA